MGSYSPEFPDITPRIRRATAGRPLDASVQRTLGHALDSSLDEVRIHSDRHADEMARDIQAEAFTAGSDVFFRSGAYRPDDRAGFKMLAHEVVHTQQQAQRSVAGTTVGNMRLSDPDDRDEREATAVASRIVRSRSKIADPSPDSSAARVSRKVRRATSVQRVGSPTRLRGIDTNYANERTVQRPDLRGAVMSYQVVHRKLDATIAAVGAAADAPAREAEILWLDHPHAKFLSDVHAAITGRPAAEMITGMETLRDRQLEKARLQDIVIADNGTVDPVPLAGRLVEYDESFADQTKTRVTVSGGKLKRSNTHVTPGGDVDTAESVTQHSGKGWEIFVVGKTGNIHMNSHKIGKYHHSSLLAGAPVAMAGEMMVSGGRVVTMSNKSGHYNPGPEHFQYFLSSLESQGVTLDFGVTGFNVPNGRADTWMGGLASSPELLDVLTVLQSFKDDGKNPTAYLVSPPPHGMGWQLNGAAGLNKPGPGGVGWVPASHDEVRDALEAKFGPAKQKLEHNANRVPQAIQWL